MRAPADRLPPTDRRAWRATRAMSCPDHDAQPGSPCWPTPAAALCGGRAGWAGFPGRVSTTRRPR
jgi:hypothetical protein